MAEIILLNGTSSSGKSSLAKALQQNFEQPFLHAGIEHYIYLLPRQYLYPPLWGQLFQYEYEKGEISTIRTAPLGHQLMSAMHQSIAALAHAGFNVVVDHVLMEESWLDEMCNYFSEFPVWFIGVQCPLEVLEMRERERKDRTLGQARAQYPLVHRDKTYDFEVNTAQHSAEECAQQIKAFMAASTPRAFQQMRS